MDTALEPMSLSTIFQVAGGLLAVLLVLGVLVFVVRRMPALRNSSGRLVRIVDAVPVGARDRIALIEAGGHRVLVGISPGRIQPLIDVTNATDSGFDGVLNESMHQLKEAK